MFKVSQNTKLRELTVHFMALIFSVYKLMWKRHTDINVTFNLTDDVTFNLTDAVTTI